MVHLDTFIHCYEQNAAGNMLTQLAYQQAMQPSEETPQQNTDQSRDVLHTLFEHASDGLALLNQSGLVLAANHALSGMLGLPTAEIIARPWEHICQPDEQGHPGFPGLWVLDTLRSGHPTSQRGRFTHPNGTACMLDIRAMPVLGQTAPHDNTHTAGLVVLQVTDITGQYALEAHQRKHAVMMATSELVRMLAHEINTPLQSLMFMLDLLEDIDKHGHDHAALINSARSEVRRIRDVLRRAHNQHTNRAPDTPDPS
jgi:PAS domain S-box-containing protein